MAQHHHDGHRERVRNRFLCEGGFDNFEDHQILELLLFYAIPRRDTNELAHRMLDEFCGLDNLINAEPEAIAARTGVSINTAILVSMTGKLMNRRNVHRQRNIVLRTTEQLKAYFIDLMKNLTVEVFYIVCLDSKKRIIRPIKVAEGSSTAITMKLNSLLADISRYGTVFAVCAHNHPNRTKAFSMADSKTTLIIRERLAEQGITLMDHILVCGDEAISMSELKKFKF